MIFFTYSALKRYLLAGCMALGVYSALAVPVKLSYIGSKPLKGDTIPSMNLLYDFKWDMYMVNSDGSITKEPHCRPDKFGQSELEAVVLYTNFRLEPGLVNQIFSMRYAFNGSSRIKINEQIILATGAFAPQGSAPSRLQHKQDDFLEFIFKDTVVRCTVEFLPYALKKRFDYDLSIGQITWADSMRKQRAESANESFFMGSFYLSFAIVFCLLFIFFRANRDNLYFALFCFFVALSLILDQLTDLTFLRNFGNFSLCIAMEFLSIFFARVLIQKDKSKIPLFLIFSIGILSSIPYIFYRFNLTLGFSLSILLFFFCLTYAGLSVLYFLIQGIGKKKWEARTITIGSLIGLALSIVPPIIIAAFLSNTGNFNGNVKFSWLGYLPDLGMCIYPVTVAIVLGKRNAWNQMQLVEHVKSIEALSRENIEKEREKKKIVEEQNSNLEIKVAERTRELAVKSEVISVKNKEITDSLLYARRIQAAILPDIKLIYKTLDQSFILYIPKDIVSGDFYGFAQRNDKVIIAAADCTGHGVAGAFMSMIGSALFNQIINEKGVLQPARILDELNDGVIHSLKQRESESNDGMDICICTLDLKNKKLEYAGANRPLWLVRNNEVIICKPNKFPIGGLQILHEEQFTNHEIVLQTKDTLYLFSDGYADQFGGEKGKKLMSKKFKDTLLAIQGLNMADQEKHLKDLFHSWKGDHEQVDDVLIIGIRI